MKYKHIWTYVVPKQVQFKWNANIWWRSFTWHWWCKLVKALLFIQWAVYIYHHCIHICFFVFRRMQDMHNLTRNSTIICTKKTKVSYLFYFYNVPSHILLLQKLYESYIFFLYIYDNLSSLFFIIYNYVSLNIYMLNLRILK